MKRRNYLNKKRKYKYLIKKGNFKKIITNKFIYKKNKNNNKYNTSIIAFMKGEKNNITYEESKNILYYNCFNFYQLKRLNEKELIFEDCRAKAIDIINNIELINGDKIIETIYKSLSYDNTNNTIIYKALLKLKELQYKDEYFNLIKDYKMHITKEVNINNNDGVQIMDINELYPINNNYYIANNENELKNILINILKILLNIANYFSFKSNLLKPLLEIEFQLKSGSLETKERKNTDDNQKLFDKNILNQIDEFFIYYKNIRAIENFNNNQPIDYDLNPILYYNILINKIFVIILKEKFDEKDENKLRIKIKENKLAQIKLIKNLIKKIINQLEKINITENINEMFKSLIFCLESVFLKEKITFGDTMIFRDDDNALTKQFVEDYINNLPEEFQLLIEKIKILEDKFIIGFNQEIEFEFNKHPKSIMDKIVNADNDIQLRQIKYRNYFFDVFQKENYFTTKEIYYLKYLVKEIANSKFFEELYSLYSEVDSLPPNILKNKYIQDYIINHISFFPYEENEYDTQAFTLNNNANIIISGFPSTITCTSDNESVYHILELSRKTIQIMHEYIHAIKRYLSIVTNSLILSETVDENNEITEAGFLLEYLMFGWDFDNYKDDNLIYQGNPNLKNKQFDIETSLKILNPQLYNNDVNSIKYILYNINSQALKNYKKQNLNNEFREYLKYMGYETKGEIKNLKKDKSQIYAGRSLSNNNVISAEFKCGNNKMKNQ